jgi:hypothetical protein
MAHTARRQPDNAPNVPWTLFALGVFHIPFGIIKFKTAFAAAVDSGFVDPFRAHEDRRTALWFTMLGPLFMLAGQTAIHPRALTHLQLHLDLCAQLYHPVQWQFEVLQIAVGVLE